MLVTTPGESSERLRDSFVSGELSLDDRPFCRKNEKLDTNRYLLKDMRFTSLDELKLKK